MTPEERMNFQENMDQLSEKDKFFFDSVYDHQMEATDSTNKLDDIAMEREMKEL